MYTDHSQGPLLPPKPFFGNKIYYEIYKQKNWIPQHIILGNKFSLLNGIQIYSMYISFFLIEFITLWMIHRKTSLEKLNK